MFFKNFKNKILKYLRIFINIFIKFYIWITLYMCLRGTGGRRNGVWSADHIQERDEDNGTLRQLRGCTQGLSGQTGMLGPQPMHNGHQDSDMGGEGMNDGYLNKDFFRKMALHLLLEPVRKYL